MRANSIWLSDVFFWRGGLGIWKEGLHQVAGASSRPADTQEQKKLHRVGPNVVIVSMTLADGGSIDVASQHESRVALLGPFAAATFAV